MKLILLCAALVGLVVSLGEQPERQRCHTCTEQNALFFEDAYYFLVHAHHGPDHDHDGPDHDLEHDVPQNPREGDHDGNDRDGHEHDEHDMDREFCHREMKIHQEWVEARTPDEFMKACFDEFEVAKKALRKDGPAEYDPFALSHDSCVEHSVCPEPEEDAAERSQEQRECRECVNRDALFTEDQKYFLAFGLEHRGPPNEQDTRHFCGSEAHIHPEWVVSDDMTAWMDHCEAKFQSNMEEARGVGFHPFAFAHDSCETKDFCVRHEDSE